MKTLVHVQTKDGKYIVNAYYDSQAIAQPIIEYYRSLGFHVTTCTTMQNTWGF